MREQPKENRVDFVVPVYNEKDNLETLYQRICASLHSDWHLYVVYDFPEDTTLETARLLAGKDSRIHLVTNTGKGVSDAITTGFAHARAEAVIVVMADESHETIEKFDEAVSMFYKTHPGVIAFSRYMKGGHAYGAPFLKGFLSRLAGVSLHYVVGLPTHDATNATRLYKKAFIDRVTVESTKGFVLTIELTLKAYFAGEGVEEIPITWRERQVGRSRFSLRKWLPAYLAWYGYALKKRYLPFL